jgi:TolA-binding protein
MKNLRVKNFLVPGLAALLLLPLAGSPGARAGQNCVFNSKGDMICDSGEQKGTGAAATLANPNIPESTYQQSNVATDSGLVYVPGAADCGANNNPTLTASGVHMDSNGVVTVSVSGSNYQSGMSVTISGATPSAYNGTFPISNATSSSFTYRISPMPSQQPSGNITVRRDTSQEQQTCIDDMQDQLDQLEQEINTLQQVLSENGSNLNQMMENMTPQQQKDFMTALQQALQGMFGNPSNSAVGTNPLSSLLNGQGTNVQQALNNALNAAGVKTNAQNGELAGANNTPASASNDCNPDITVGTDGKKYMTVKDEHGNNIQKEVTEGSTDTSPLCGPGWGQKQSQIAQCIGSMTPKRLASGTTSCGASVSSILQSMGYLPPGARTMEAQDYGQKVLKPNGWKLLDGGTVTNCPPGGVLVYWSDNRLGQAPTIGRSGKPTGGSKYGHVEISTGKNTYTYFTTTNKAGGSLNAEKNFKECWVYPGAAPANPPKKDDRGQNFQACFK